LVDSPTLRSRFRKQEVGTNVNSWGTNLNEVLDALDQVIDGVESIDLGGATSYTLTTTNYTTADEAKNRVLVFANANASGTTVIVPSVEHVYGCVNIAGGTVTTKTSAGTGLAIPDGKVTWVYCDAADVESLASNYIPSALQVAGKISGVTAGTAATDAVNKTQMEAAIAVLAGVLAGGLVLNSSTDLAAGYLANKLTVSGSLVKSTTNAGTVNEATNIAFTFDEGQGGLYAGVFA
jgi:hypothetical protein